MSEPIGIYLHVPFCRRKCPYCDFYSIPGASEGTRKAYQQAVCRNLRHYATGQLSADSVYLGGGTPSLLPPEAIAEILSCLSGTFSLREDAEITLEANPATVTAQSLSAYRRAGVNRLSIGVQSLNPRELSRLGRLHTAQEAIQTIQDAAQAGFSNLSCDLMLGTPEQTRASLEQTLETLLTLPLTHLSAYLLKIEPGTPFARQYPSPTEQQEDLAADLYLQAVECLERHGLRQYEISNFARSGFESRHNLKYWTCQPYLGIGPSAHSCLGGRRFFTPRDLDSFLRRPVQEELLEDSNPCTPSERILLGLRLRRGLPLSLFSPQQKSLLRRYAANGLVQLQQDRAALTPKGFLVSNSILCELL